MAFCSSPSNARPREESVSAPGPSKWSHARSRLSPPPVSDLRAQARVQLGTSVVAAAPPLRPGAVTSLERQDLSGAGQQEERENTRTHARPSAPTLGVVARRVSSRSVRACTHHIWTWRGSFARTGCIATGDRRRVKDQEKALANRIDSQRAPPMVDVSSRPSAVLHAVRSNTIPAAQAARDCRPALVTGGCDRTWRRPACRQRRTRTHVSLQAHLASSGQRQQAAAGGEQKPSLSLTGRATPTSKVRRGMGAEPEGGGR